MERPGRIFPISSSKAGPYLFRLRLYRAPYPPRRGLRPIWVNMLNGLEMLFEMSKSKSHCSQHSDDNDNDHDRGCFLGEDRILLGHNPGPCGPARCCCRRCRPCHWSRPCRPCRWRRLCRSCPTARGAAFAGVAIDRLARAVFGGRAARGASEEEQRSDGPIPRGKSASTPPRLACASGPLAARTRPTRSQFAARKCGEAGRAVNQPVDCASTMQFEATPECSPSDAPAPTLTPACGAVVPEAGRGSAAGFPAGGRGDGIGRAGDARAGGERRRGRGPLSSPEGEEVPHPRQLHQAGLVRLEDAPEVDHLPHAQLRLGRGLRLTRRQLGARRRSTPRTRRSSVCPSS